MGRNLHEQVHEANSSNLDEFRKQKKNEERQQMHKKRQRNVMHVFKCKQMKFEEEYVRTAEEPTQPVIEIPKLKKRPATRNSKRKRRLN